MRNTIVLTFIADDRPGLVETLSDTVTEGGGNWLESRMAHLAGKFAGIARIDAPTDRLADLRSALLALQADGFQITVEEADAKSGADRGAPGSAYHIDLVGPDQPGIVRDITRCLVENGVSVEEMETDIRNAPMGGGDLFYARAKVRVPKGLDEEDLRGSIEDVAGALMVDIEISDEPQT